MRNVLIKELVEPRTIVLAILALMFEVSVIRQVGADPHTNSWDVLLPSLTHSHFIVVFGLLWWVILLHDNQFQFKSTMILLRNGSKIALQIRTIATNLVRLLAACLAVFLMSIPVSAVSGFSNNFSSSALGMASRTEGLDVFGAAHWSKVMDNPWLAIIATLGLALLAFLGLAAVHGAMALNGRDREASYLLVAVYLWASAASFGAAERFPQFDLVNFFVFGWAKQTDSLVPVILFWSFLITGGIWFTKSKSPIYFLVDFPKRWSLLLMVAVFSTMISIGTRAGTFAKSWSIVFAGKDATLVGYSQTALLMYLVASGAVLRFAEFDEKHFPHFHLRFGRRRRWLGNQLLQAAKFCVSGTVVIFIAIFFTVVLHNHNLASQDIVLVSSTAFGMLLSMLVITTFGLVAYSFSKSAESWVWVVGVSLVLGYLPTTVPGNLSILTLYSHSIVSHEVVRLQSFSAGGLVLVVGLILLHIANLVSRNGSVRLLERDRG